MLKQIFYHNDTYYVVLRKLKVHSVSNSNGVINMDALKAWRDYVGADHVLRQNDEYLLCETVKDAQLVEDEQ